MTEKTTKKERQARAAERLEKSRQQINNMLIETTKAGRPQPATGVYQQGATPGRWELCAILFDTDAGNSIEALLRHSNDFKFQEGDAATMEPWFETEPYDEETGS